MWNVEPKIACCQADSSATGDRKDCRTKHIYPKKEGNGAGKFGKERKCYVFLIFLLTGKGTCDILFTERRRSFFYAKKRNHQMEVEVLRTRITLACTECKQRNYSTTKDKKVMPDRMEIKKYCKFCKAHTLHKETK